MSQSEKKFPEFWREVRIDILLTHLKVFIRLPLAIFIAITTIRLLRCAGVGADEILKQYECSIVLQPSVLLGSLFQFFPTMMKGIGAAMPFFFGAVLYLEWDKYKNDKPSDFTHGKCEGPPGYKRRLKWVNASLWDIAGQSISAIDLGKQSKRYEGAFDEDELLSSLRRKFARTENKPIEDGESLIRWRIVQNNGQEVHIDLQRQNAHPACWVMTTSFYDWAGRNQPPRLVETHHTEFVASSSKNQN